MRPALHVLLLILVVGLTMDPSQAGPPTQFAPLQVETSPPSLSPDALFHQVAPSVFVVEGFGPDQRVLRQGSGVAVAHEGVITNRHVVAGAALLRVRQGARTWMATVAGQDSTHDLVRLRVPGLTAPAVPLRVSADLRIGERVYAIGAPQGLELSISEGLISGLRLFEGRRAIQTTAPISAGSSGGGLFDDRGRLVGITTFFANNSQNLNFASPVEWVAAQGSQPAQSSAAQGGSAGPSDHAGWLAQGMSAWAKEEYTKAASAFREAIRLKPDDARAWNWLGSTYRHQGEHADAIAAFRESVRIDPAAADPWASLGDVYRAQGQVEQAITAYRTAVQLDPEDRFAWRSLIDICRDRGRIDEAVAAISDSLRARPDIARTWSAFGDLLLDQGRSSEAIAAYQEAIRREPGNAVVWISLGRAHEDLGEIPRAITAYHEAIRLKPKDAQAWYSLGKTYAARGERGRVIEVYQRLKDLHGETADAFFRRYVLP
jgi:tetratricopeptide (TPR) repeat protein